MSQLFFYSITLLDRPILRIEQGYYMSSKITPHNWVPSQYLRTIFSRPIIDAIRNEAITKEQLKIFIEGVYASNYKLKNVFEVPDAEQLANDMFTLKTNVIQTDCPWTETYRWLRTHPNIRNQRRINEGISSALEKVLNSRDIVVPLPKDHRNSPNSKIAIPYVCTGLLVILKQAYIAQ